jgi:hypothetical protein
MANELGQVGVTLANDRFLNRYFIAAMINEWVDAQLYFMRLVPRIETNSQTITATREKYGLLDNPERRKMRPLVSGTSFKDIEITLLDTVQTAVRGRGFKIVVHDEARRYQEGIDNIVRAIQTIGNYAVRDINDEMGLALQKGVRQAKAGDKFYDFVNADGYVQFSSDECVDYIKTLSRLKRTIKYEEKSYRLDQVFINEEDFGAFLEYLATANISQDAKKSMFWAEMNMQVPTVTLSALGLTVNSLMSGIDPGAVLGLDSQNPPMSMFYTHNALFPQAQENFPTPVTPLGLHLDTKDDRDAQTYTIKVWFENAFLVRTPESGYYGEGL